MIWQTLFSEVHLRSQGIIPSLPDSHLWFVSCIGFCSLYYHVKPIIVSSAFQLAVVQLWRSNGCIEYDICIVFF